MFYKVGNLSNIILDYIVSSNIMVKIIAVETTEAYEMIKNNLLDFAIVNNWECEIPDDIEYHVFSEERLVLLMSRNNPYANKKSILLEEIGNLDILMDNLEPKNI